MNDSISKARTVVNERFEEIKKEIAHVLEARQRGILSTIAEIERKDLDPLTTLEDRINGDLDKTLQCIEKGKKFADNCEGQQSHTEISPFFVNFFTDCQFFVVQDDYLNDNFSMSCSNRKLIFEFVISAGRH